MKNAVKILLLISFLISPQLYALPKAFNAEYDVSKSGFSLGTMQASLNYQGNQYHYHKLTKAKGLAAILSGDTLTENSDGIVQGESLIPKSYLRHHISKRKDKKDQFHFKTATSVQGNYDNKAYQLTVPANTSDLSLLELRLMQDIAAGKTQTKYNIVDRGELKQYSFNRLGTVTLKLKTGSYACEKVRVSRKNNKRQTTLWLAKALDYLPVRILHNDNGDKLEARMTAYHAQ